jgi:hypothetical protein
VAASKQSGMADMTVGDSEKAFRVMQRVGIATFALAVGIAVLLAVAVGVLAGVVFLLLAAPALTLGTTIAVEAVAKRLRPTRTRR